MLFILCPGRTLLYSRHSVCEPCSTSGLAVGDHSSSRLSSSWPAASIKPLEFRFSIAFGTPVHAGIWRQTKKRSSDGIFLMEGVFLMLYLLLVLPLAGRFSYIHLLRSRSHYFSTSALSPFSSAADLPLTASAHTVTDLLASTPLFYLDFIFCLVPLHLCYLSFTFLSCSVFLYSLHSILFATWVSPSLDSSKHDKSWKGRE